MGSYLAQPVMSSEKGQFDNNCVQSNFAKSDIATHCSSVWTCLLHVLAVVKRAATTADKCTHSSAVMLQPHHRSIRYNGPAHP